jgi:hypothetical protein
MRAAFGASRRSVYRWKFAPNHAKKCGKKDARKKTKTRLKFFSLRRKKPANSVRLGQNDPEKAGVIFVLASHTRTDFFPPILPILMIVRFQ